MAKPRKNKTGLHKNVASVLECVPIPQGVRNWQPPDKRTKRRTGDSSAAAKSNVSSVFKGVSLDPDDILRPPAIKQQQKQRAEVPPVEAPDERKTSQSNLVKKLDSPEESMVKAAPPRRPKPTKSVVYRGDPKLEAGRPAVGRRVKGKLPAQKVRFSKTRRNVLAVSVLVLAIVAVPVYRHNFTTTVRETEASAGNDLAAVAIPKPHNDIDWQIPEPLPIVTIDPIESPEQDAAQKQQKTGQKEIIDLRAILFSAHRPSAVVHGRIVYVGDKIGDVTIANIRRDTVEFARDGKTWVQKVSK